MSDWSISEEDNKIKFDCMMDNFDMKHYLKLIGISFHAIEEEDDN